MTKGKPRCQATRRDGTTCRAPANGDTGLCIGHGPASSTKTRQQGGYARSNVARMAKVLPSRMRPVLEKLERAVQEVHDGALTPQQASAMATLASAIVRVMHSADLEERVRDLEQIMKER